MKLTMLEQLIEKGPFIGLNPKRVCCAHSFVCMWAMKVHVLGREKIQVRTPPTCPKPKLSH